MSRIADFTASADIYHGRIIVRWTELPDERATLPVVTLRRKQRDFAFPDNAPRYLIYDSAAFPPPDLPHLRHAHRLPDEAGSTEGLQWLQQTWSVARIGPDGPVEVLRRTARTYLRVDGAAMRRDVEIIDGGDGPEGLPAGRPHYYRLDDTSDPAGALRATTTPTGAHHYDQVLYDALPVVYRRHDTVARPSDPATAVLPEATTPGGQLRRLVDVFGAAVGALRGSADGLRPLRDIDTTDARFLPALAQWIGWNLADDDIARQRNEILAAPRHYGTIGTLRGISDIVEHYTGWSVRIGEPAHNIALTNTAPQANLFAAVESADGHWSAPDDAAAVLGLAGLSGAHVTGTAAEPFALADAMTLTIAVDHAAPVVMRLSANDFTDITTASAEQVAAAIAATIRALDCTAVDGKVLLRSRRGDDSADIAIPPAPASLVSLDGAAHGRLSAVPCDAEGTGPGWLAYAATTSAAGTPYLRLKAHLRGHFYDAQPIGADTEAQVDPAVVTTGGQLWCAFVSDPGATASLRYRLGTTAPLTAARLRGDRREPFKLTDGQQLTVTGSAGEHTFVVHSGDYPDLTAVTAAQLQDTITGQLPGVAAHATPDGRLELATTAVGPGITLGVEPKTSTAARLLGFGAPELVSRGDWDPTVSWGPAHDVPHLPRGRHADCTAATEPDGAVRLCWSNHNGAVWRLMTARWSPRVLASTPHGVTVISADATSTVTTADGLPSDDVRAAVVDATGTTWFATAAGVGARARNGTTTVFTTASTAGALASDDIRSAAVSPDGTVWFATAAGAACRDTTNTWQTFGTAAGLPSNDVRDIAVSSDSAIWAATAAGVALRRTAGWQIRDTGSHDTRRLFVAPDGALWVATNAGVVTLNPDGAATPDDLSGLGAGATDVRDLVADGATMWLATAAGIVEYRTPHDRQLHAAEAGLDNLDCRAITLVDGDIWVATATAILAGHDGRWALRAPVAGAQALCGPWSTAQAVANPAAGERDPHLAANGSEMLLAAARRTASASGGTWRLTLRRQRADAATWSDSDELTVDGAIDREPVIAATPGGRVQVYFRSNRDAGQRIWRLELDADGHAGPPLAVTSGPSADTHPAVIARSPAATDLLLFRSDRHVSLGAIADVPTTPVPRLTSLRRYAGATTVVLGDADRNATHGRFADLLDYTPQRPRGDTPQQSERYTPGTVTVFFDRGRAAEPLVPDDPQRLRQLLSEFLPANTRVVPAPTAERT